jgi:PAS domain S-box-containing protein
VVVPRAEDTISGYILLEDVYGQPAVIARVDLARDSHRQGHKVMLYFTFALVVCMVMLGVVMHWLLQRFVTSRLSALTTTIGGIAARQDASARVAVEGRDELGSLATSLNQMLAAIEHSQHAVKENEARLRTVLESVQTGIMIVDAETHRILEVNDAVLEMSGYARHEIVGNQCACLLSPPEDGKCPIRDLGEQSDNAERVLLTKDGRRVPVLKRAVKVALGGRNCILESVLDITDRKRAEEAFRHQAYHDGLTGLPNRLQFQEHLTEAVAQAQRDGTEVAVLMLDLDHFKTINDTLGHSAGDKLLMTVA